MKKILLSAVIVSACVYVASAQEQKPVQQPSQVVKQNDQQSYQAKQAADWNNLLRTELKLTDDQVTKIAIINKDFADKKDAILKDATLADDAKLEKKEALKKDREAKMNEVLTPDQQVKYKQLMEAKMKEMEAKKDAPKQ